MSTEEQRGTEVDETAGREGRRDARDGGTTTAAPPAAAPESPAADTEPGTPPPYSRFRMRLHGDTAGRQFTQCIDRDGHPDKFMGVVIVEKKWPDGLVARQQYPFEIPALAVDDAFAKYDEAREAARVKGDADLEHQHIQMLLTARTPIPIRTPGRGNGPGPKRRIIQ